MENALGTPGLAKFDSAKTICTAVGRAAEGYER
jgi:hypothetical protein